MFKKAKCERTGNLINIVDGFLVGEPLTGEWQFVAQGAPEKADDYAFPVRDVIIDAAEYFDWMAHLAEKTWFRPEKFFDCFIRVRRDRSTR